MKGVTIKERGYPGHFIMAYDCLYRRNTLVSDGERHVVVSSVGNCRPNDADVPREIGCRRYFETLVFRGTDCGDYIEADVAREISIDADLPRGIHADNPKRLPSNVDAVMDNQHDAIVRWVSDNFESIIAESTP